QVGSETMVGTVIGIDFSKAQSADGIITIPLVALLTKAGQLQSLSLREVRSIKILDALFCLYNRYVDGLATVAPTDPNFYKGIGERLKNNGYNRLPQGYDHLKKTNPQTA
ncbi:MAG TPA: hypothetical protein PL045_05015, partial [Chitinophagaceae bacterium]|nr:hypothetical protein [Chitinophagaceae bacterium]